METRHDVVLHLAARAEELGYDAFLLAEGWGHDAAVLLGAIAARTRRIRIGTGRAERLGAQRGRPSPCWPRPWTRCPAAGSSSAWVRAPRSSPRACTTSGSPPRSRASSPSPGRCGRCSPASG